jgi:hypothetical protein
MPKRKTKKTTRNSSRQPAWHTSRIDNHPMLTVIFLLFSALVVALAFMAYEAHKAADEPEDHHMNILVQPSTTVSPAVKSY